jgi:hypothetical protein
MPRHLIALDGGVREVGPGPYTLTLTDPAGNVISECEVHLGEAVAVDYRDDRGVAFWRMTAGAGPVPG